MHDRRARPTIRVLKEDLTTGWNSPLPQRQLAAGKYQELHPLTCLPHPIIAKAARCFGSDAAADNHEGPIASSTNVPLLEIKQSQWRGGIWEDGERGVCWLVVAGLAKGDHKDWEDFYEHVERENKIGDPRRWLPTDLDIRLLKRETAARILTEWELETQRSVRNALNAANNLGVSRFEVRHPVHTEKELARVSIEITKTREDGYAADEIEVSIVPARAYAGSELSWQLTIRVLISLSPPEQGWDRYQNYYFNIGEADSWSTRVSELDQLISVNQLAVSEPGMTSHYAHRVHLGDCTVNGTAIRALRCLFCANSGPPINAHLPGMRTKTRKIASIMTLVR